MGMNLGYVSDKRQSHFNVSALETTIAPEKGGTLNGPFEAEARITT